MKNLINTTLLFVCIAVVVGAFAFTLDELGLYLFGFKWPLHCLANHLFGIRCAFCGMTRSFAEMAHGNVSAAFGFHHLGPAFFSFAVLQIPYRIWVLAISPKSVGRRLARVHAATAAIVLMAILTDWLIYLGGRLL
ncbi:MAG: DUF2752 domain-containing protein [Phycisphaerae bacterium]|nr:DUF2752 domain-containing protein [Phycisphaerae bacterium]